MSETYYKILERHADGTLRSCHGGDAIWSEPQRVGFAEYAPGAPMIAHATPAICESGVHLTTNPLEWLTVIGAECYIAEPIGPSRGRMDDKYVFDGARLLEPVEIPYWWREVEAFVASIPSIPWMRRIAPPQPEWRVFPTRTAAYDTARDTAYAAAYDTARVTTSNAAYDTARVTARVTTSNAAYDAARDTAYAAAYAAARDAAYGFADAAAYVAAHDVGYAVSLLAQVISCGGLPLDPRCLAHARARWEVWQRGYGLLCDVNGVLYVYEVLK